MSDGGCLNGKPQMKLLYDQFKNNGILIYVIGFGKLNEIYSLELKSVADAGNGKLLDSVNEIQLKTNFLEISSSLGVKVSVSKSLK